MAYRIIRDCDILMQGAANVTRPFDYVVIGAGPAGGAASLELVRNAAQPSVALIGTEPYAPYERPPLSKATLLSDSGPVGPQFLFGGIEGLSAAGVTTFIPETAALIDPQQRIVRLASGDSLSYGKLLLATGTSARTLQSPGAELDGVHYLRTYEDATGLAKKLRSRHKLVVIGGGFIGLEVAASARRAGCEVALIEAGPHLMGRAAPLEVARMVLEKFRAEGVDVRLATSVRELRGSTRVTSVLLSNGAELPADIVLIGIGAVPNDALARAIGLDVANGVVTDETGRTTDPSIYAAGDVACRLQNVAGFPQWTKRLEAWEPAIEQGVSTAHAMLGKPVEPASPPWIWSDQFDWNLQFVGHGELADEVVERTGTAPNSLTVFQLCNRRLVGMITVNDARNMALGRRAVLRPVELDTVRLTDPTIPIKEALRPVQATVQTEFSKEL
ncbi:FAD-dependent oxidoreductase [Burkholderia gladioli pv. gladioli]|nr:FAD-dependent oxidoreductase [Burkholderia gladioli]AJW98748.1 pyridine nucleotide-disulfide oxidoreductase family protein [Burkholderia gladioli]KGC11676.1 pyridine nucleotide-disulfide oxidoreductase family protein [Burkholderia gladioli]MDJ1164235.1 FAD-dependent oxidoreductase [Burkholderia gladioli pv. gladioli]QPQ84143.1 FAD-dependent oxidoreductase [Burkholderia gladioli]